MIDFMFRKQEYTTQIWILRISTVVQCWMADPADRCTHIMNVCDKLKLGVMYFMHHCSHSIAVMICDDIILVQQVKVEESLIDRGTQSL